LRILQQQQQAHQKSVHVVEEQPSSSKVLSQQHHLIKQKIYASGASQKSVKEVLGKQSQSALNLQVKAHIRGQGRVDLIKSGSVTGAG